MSVASRSSSRNGAAVIWIGLHTTEGGGTARDLLNADWWTGSSHAIVDNTTLLTPADGCVPYDRGAWTLRNGNAKSENIEQVGYASWSRDYWLANRMPQLRLAASWVHERSIARGIPLEYIGIAGVQQNRRGIIQHNDYSKGTGDGTHWDCGPGYPTDVVMNLARNSQPAAKKNGSEEDVMILLNNGGGPGPFGAKNVGLLSGGIFSWLDPASHKASVEDGMARGNAVMWVDNIAWNEIIRQSAQIRDVEMDGKTRRPAPIAPISSP